MERIETLSFFVCLLKRNCNPFGCFSISTSIPIQYFNLIGYHFIISTALNCYSLISRPSSGFCFCLHNVEFGGATWS
ncbi:unnamed protein product [Citrullus colocynthis]|uniref:Uncharacterized protein n=1 Tax=Citrullus colocynthis TaxID=252529 RepID=A0ABP0Y2N5_9ROSI